MCLTLTIDPTWCVYLEFVSNLSRQDGPHQSLAWASLLSLSETLVRVLHIHHLLILLPQALRITSQVLRGKKP